MFFGSKLAYVRRRGSVEEADDDVEVFDEDEVRTGLTAKVAEMNDLLTSPSPAMAPSAAPGAPAKAGISGFLGGLFGRRSSASAPEGETNASARAASVLPPRPRQEKKVRGPASQLHRREVDTNIVSLALGSLAEAATVATGDVVICGNTSCGAMLSARSVLIDHTGRRIRGAGDLPVVSAASDASAPPAASAPLPTVAETDESASTPVAAVAPTPTTSSDLPTEEGQWLWTCEFCSHRNTVLLDAEEIPKEESLDYIEAVSTTAGASGAPSTAAEDTSLIVFCIDISGSMCVSTEVEGKLELKGDWRKEAPSFLTAGDSQDQYFGRQRRDVTYVSRLQAVQAAITTQIEAVKAAAPNRRVALVTFNGEVTIYGDGGRDPRVIAGDRLTQYDYLLTAGSEYTVDRRVVDSAETLNKRVFELSETGPTALGPAVVVAAAMASRERGSKIVLCTDGLANVGLGAVDEDTPAPTAPGEDGSAPTETAAEAFYRRVGEFAASKGVTIDVLGIEGDGCNLETLGQLAELTGGDVTQVNPTNVTKNFSSILSKKILATHVSVTLLLHAGMAFRYQDGVTGNKLFRDIGNVTEESQFSFEYSTRPAHELTPGLLTGLTELPFQVQIRYTRLNGMQCVRVISRSQAVTEDRYEAEREMQTRVVAGHAAQQAAVTAQKGAYHASRVTGHAYNSLLARNMRDEEDRTVYRTWAQHQVQMDDMLGDEEREEEAVYGAPASALEASTEMTARRKQTRGKKDGLSATLRSAAKASPSLFKS